MPGRVEQPSLQGLSQKGLQASATSFAQAFGWRGSTGGSQGMELRLYKARPRVHQSRVYIVIKGLW